MIENKAYLNAALERIFKPTSQVGFWDEQNNRIHGKLIHDKSWHWKVDSEKADRYGLFCLSTILLAKVLYGLDLSRYEQKIVAYLKYIQKNIRG